MPNHRYEEIKRLLEALEPDFEKFFNRGNRAAGIRVRKGLQTLKNLTQEIRVEVQGVKNQLTDEKKRGGPGKKRARKTGKKRGKRPGGGGGSGGGLFSPMDSGGSTDFD